MTDTTLNTLSAAQQDMREAYANGGLGVLTSATAWAVAGGVAVLNSPEQAVWALFIGGMLIHPVSVLLAKALGRRGNHTAGNPLAALAMANTFWLIFMLPLAFVVSRYRLEWFFPAMLMVIGGRYLTFAPMFGLRLYWVLGGTLAVAAYALVALRASPAMGAFTGAALEALFGLMLLMQSRRAG